MKKDLKLVGGDADRVGMIRGEGKTEGRYSFVHDGRAHTLFQRGSSKWYIHFQFDGERYKRCLDTGDLVVAEKRAVMVIDSVVAAKWLTIAQAISRPPDVTPLEKNDFTLAHVEEVYERVATIAPRTAKNNVLCLLKVVEKATGQRQKSGSVRLLDITASLVSRYQDAIVREYLRDAAKDEPAQRAARDQALRSSRSVVNQARSVFSVKGEQDFPARYAETGIVLPGCIGEFMRARLRGKKLKAGYRGAPPELIQATFEAIERMRHDEDVFKAFWLFVGTGLRRKEVHHCQWDHFREINGHMFVTGGIGKDGLQIDIPVQARAWEVLKPFRKAAGRVITTRSDRWARRLSKWMRGLGWTTNKTLHELRAYLCSLLYKEDPQAAMHQLRHKSIKVTEESYSRRYLEAIPLDVL